MTEKKTEPVEQADEQGPGSLTQAILRVQAKLNALDLGRNADGQIQSRTYKYLTYAKLLEQMRPLLAENELLWQTFPTTLDGHPALRYRLTFAPSGETQEDTMLLAVDDGMTSQAQGSAVSYARRYALQAVFEIAPDDDDDGAQASRERSRTRQSRARHTPRLLEDDELQRMTAAIRAKGFEPTEIFKQVGIEEPLKVNVDQALAVAEVLKGGESSRRGGRFF